MCHKLAIVENVIIVSLFNLQKLLRVLIQVIYFNLRARGILDQRVHWVNSDPDRRGRLDKLI